MVLIGLIGLLGLIGLVLKELRLVSEMLVVSVGCIASSNQF